MTCMYMNAEQSGEEGDKQGVSKEYNKALARVMDVSNIYPPVAFRDIDGIAILGRGDKREGSI